jgi:hypothetical protein
VGTLLVQLEQLCRTDRAGRPRAGTGDERDPVHLDALLLQVTDDDGVGVVDPDRGWFAPSSWVSDSIRCSCWPPAASCYVCWIALERLRVSGLDELRNGYLHIKAM